MIPFYKDLFTLEKRCMPFFLLRHAVSKGDVLRLLPLLCKNFSPSFSAMEFPVSVMNLSAIRPSSELGGFLKLSFPFRHTAGHTGLIRSVYCHFRRYGMDVYYEKLQRDSDGKERPLRLRLWKIRLTGDKNGYPATEGYGSQDFIRQLFRR